MRSFALVLFLFATASVAAQSITDTIFWNNGNPQQVLHYSLIVPDELTNAELFQRGISRGDDTSDIKMMDSIRLYDESGVFLRTMPSRARSRAHRRKKMGVNHQDSLRSGPAAEYLEGRGGMIVRKKIRLPAGKEFNDLRRLDDYQGFEILQTPTDTNGSFTVKIRIPAGAATPKLRLDTGEETDWEKPFSLRGYHLNETDFKRRSQLTDQQTWRAEGQDFLYLRLRSTEKLMHIYRNGEQYTVLPVGRQLDEVHVGSLPAGKYLLEIIDLGTREKRYYWVVTQG